MWGLVAAVLFAATVASAGYTAYEVGKGAINAAGGATQSSRASRDAAEEFARAGGGASLDQLQQDYTEGQLRQHQALADASKALTEDVLKGVGPNALSPLGDGPSTSTWETVTKLPELIRSGIAAVSEIVSPVNGDGTYLGKIDGWEDIVRDGKIETNKVEIKVFGDILTFSVRAVLRDVGISFDGTTVLCSASVEAVIEETPMSLPAGGAFGDTVRWNYRHFDWTGADCDDDSRDQDPYDDIEVKGHVLDGGTVEGALIEPASGVTIGTFTADLQ